MLPPSLIDKIGHGDCAELIRLLPPASIDAIVCDPPYGLGSREPTATDIDGYLRGGDLNTGGDFMGLNWSMPTIPVWRECFRVLKPGGYLASFGGTRTWDIIALGIRAAGFDDQDTISRRFGSSCLQWVHGQGFPKSTNISKKLRERAKARAAQGDVDGEAKLLKRAEAFVGFGTTLKPAWEPILLFRRTGPELVKPTLPAPFLYCPKSSRRERTVDRRVVNDHPCVKPVRVMRWLLRLLAPAGGIVLDPFAGSGTTVEAAIREGMHYVAVEREKRWVELIAQRAILVRDDVQREVAGEQLSSRDRGRKDRPRHP